MEDKILDGVMESTLFKKINRNWANLSRRQRKSHMITWKKDLPT